MPSTDTSKKRTLDKIFLLLALLWMCLIFAFSARNGDASSEDSARIGRMICSVFVPNYEELPTETQQLYAERIDHPIRKAAHATEYAILAMLWLGCLWSLHRGRYPLAWLLTTCYAATDEFHQLFVPGRSGQFSDVCLDSIGAAVGLLLVLLVMKIR